MGSSCTCARNSDTPASTSDEETPAEFHSIAGAVDPLTGAPDQQVNSLSSHGSLRKKRLRKKKSFQGIATAHEFNTESEDLETPKGRKASSDGSSLATPLSRRRPNPHLTIEMKTVSEGEPDDFEIASDIDNARRQSEASAVNPLSAKRPPIDSDGSTDEEKEEGSDEEGTFYSSQQTPVTVGHGSLNPAQCAQCGQSFQGIQNIRFCFACGHTVTAAPPPVSPFVKASNSTSQHPKSPSCPPLAMSEGEEPERQHSTVSVVVRNIHISKSKRSVLGRGATGTVYSVMDTNTGQNFAMKEVIIGVDDDQRLKEVKQEVKHLSRLKHPNVIQYYGVMVKHTGKGKMKLRFLMELLGGGSLRDVVEKHKHGLPKKVVAIYTDQILSAITFVHNQQVTHSDIKPQNILMSTNGTLKLSDFGSALDTRYLEADGVEVKVSGTPNYMPPESLDPDSFKKVSYRQAHDIWSIGCTVYELATGKCPWEDLRLPPYALLMHIKNEGAPPLPPAMSEDLKSFLQMCFTIDIAKRPTAEELCGHPFIMESSLCASVDNSSGIFKLVQTHNNVTTPKVQMEYSNSTFNMSQGSIESDVISPIHPSMPARTATAQTAPRSPSPRVPVSRKSSV